MLPKFPEMSIASWQVVSDSEVNCLNQAWLLKNSFDRFSAQNLVCKLLKLRSTQRLKLAKITALVPFSTPTGVNTH